MAEDGAAQSNRNRTLICSSRPTAFLRPFRKRTHALLANGARCPEHLTGDSLCLVGLVHSVAKVNVVCERAVVAVTESERRRTHRSAPETLVESNGTEPDAGPFVRYNVQEYVFGAVRVWQ